MKSVPVVAFEPVRDDVQSAYDYFEERLSGGGDRFLAQYFATTDRIALNPEMFPLTFADYRRALVPKSNLAVYYFIAVNRAVVVAVIDARRNPRLIRRLVRERRTSA
jgi:plasmid stabilization system protein ParE